MSAQHSANTQHNCSGARQELCTTCTPSRELHRSSSMRAGLLALGTASCAPLLALTPVRMHANLSWQPLFDYDPAVPVASDADVVSLHEDAVRAPIISPSSFATHAAASAHQPANAHPATQVWGVPWEHFLSGGTTPPAAFWTEHIRHVIASTSAGGPWAAPRGAFLSLSLVNHGGGRTCPAGNASSASEPNKPFAGCSACYDFDPNTNPGAAAVRAAYVAYARYMVGAIKPAWVCHAVEVNLYRQACGATRWASLVSFANQVYDSLKADAPNTIFFPSFQVRRLRRERHQPKGE